MKKLLIVLLALTVIGSFATAQVTIGTWNRIGTNFYRTYDNASATFGNELTNPVVSNQPGWGRIALQFSAKAEKAGMAAEVTINAAGSLGKGDYVKLWAKPFDGVELDFGTGVFDALRGKIGGGSPIAVEYTAGDEDGLFMRIKMNQGAYIALTPVPGLFIGGTVSSTQPTAKDAYSAMQVGAGYTIEGIGQIRAQYVGDSSTGTNEYVQAGFALVGAVPGLTADVTGKFFIDADTTSQHVIAAAVQYSANGLAAQARTQVKLATDAKDLDACFSGVVDYTMGMYVVGSDFNLTSILDLGKRLGITPHVKMNLPGGGQLVTGVQLLVQLDGNEDFTVGIPMLITY